MVQCTHSNPPCAHLCAGTSQHPLPKPTSREGIFLVAIPGDPHLYLLHAAHQKPRHTITPHRTPGSRTVPSPETPPSHPIPWPPATRASTQGPKRAIVLFSLKAEATIPRDLDGENHIVVEGLTEHILTAARYAAAANAGLWEDRPAPPLAQATHNAPKPGPTAEEVHDVLNMWAPRKAHPMVRPICLIGWDAMDAPPGNHGGARAQTLRHLVDGEMG